MNKYIVLFALLALAASAFALSLPIDKKKLKFPKVPKCFCIRAPCNCGQWDEESDIAWVPVGIWAAKAFGAGALGAAGKHAYDKFIRRKDAQESDIAWVPAAIWAGKAIGAGALGAAGAHAYDKIFRRGKRDSVESDLSIGTLVTAYNLYKKFKKDNVASDADFKFLKKIGGIAKKGFSLYQKAKGLGFFADKFNFKKIGSIAKKGFETYNKIKGLGFFDDAESDKEFRDALVAKLKDRVKDKLKSQLKDGGKKLCVLTKLRAKPFCAARTKVESDKINWKNLFSQKNLEKAVGIYKAIKGGESVESDAEFLKKLKKWWDEKGKGLFEKGKNLFNKGKEIYAILKNKSAPAPESDKIDWSKVKKYLTPENLQKAVDIWKVLKNKDATESDFYGQVAQWLGKKAVEQAGKFGYNKIFRRKDEAEEQAPAEKPAKKQKKAAGVTLKGLVAKLRKQRAAAQENNKDGKKKFNFKNLLSKVQKLRSEKKQSKDGEKPKRKFDIKSLIAKIAKKRAEKKQKKEKKVEEPQQVNDQASG